MLHITECTELLKGYHNAKFVYYRILMWQSNTEFVQCMMHLSNLLLQRAECPVLTSRRKIPGVLAKFLVKNCYSDVQFIMELLWEVCKQFLTC